MTRQASYPLLTPFRVVDDTLIIDLGKRRPVLSSAPRAGGLVHVRYIVNHQVHANPVAAPMARRRWTDPSRDLGRLAGNLGIDRQCVALMTAVAMTQLVAIRLEHQDLWVEGFFTVGVTNAVRAGEKVATATDGGPHRTTGTINIIVVTNARLSVSAMVGAIQVVTEAKTAALLDRRVKSWTGRAGATGTGTDAVVIASGNGPALRYSGTHTEIGSLIGQLVSRGMEAGLARAFRPGHSSSSRPHQI
jgi:iron complex transport system ATP-binding protein